MGEGVCRGPTSRAFGSGLDWGAALNSRQQAPRTFERPSSNFPADLLDCLQLSDKLQIALQNKAFVESSGFGSAAAAKKVIKNLEALRNNLAHGQAVTSHDWPQIVRLARRIQQMYGNEAGRST